MDDAPTSDPHDGGRPARSSETLPATGEPTTGTAGSELRASSLWRWRGSSSLAVGVLFAVLGLFAVAGALAFRSDDALANARPADLVQILDGLETENDRLLAEQRRLEAELETLRSGTSAEALARSQERLEALEVLAGTEPVRGPGIRMVIRDPADVVDAAELVNAVQELRGAGAESIEVSQRRVVVDTWFADPGSGRPGILISGEVRESPYTILAIGDAQTLATAMQIPGGLADSIRTAGASFEIDVRDSIDITSTVPLEPPDYAEPAEAP